MKNEKKKRVQIWKGYCPNRIVRARILYCNTVIVLQRRRLEGWKLYCNTADCIARVCNWLEKTNLYCRGSSVLQYSGVQGVQNCSAIRFSGQQVYCNRAARQGWTVLRYSAQPSHDTAMEARRRAALGRTGRAGRRELGRTGAGGRVGRTGGRRVGAGGRAGAGGRKGSNGRAARAQ